MTSFETAVLRRPPASPAPRVVAGTVTRSDATGVWVTALGADQAHPSGPCRGAWRDVLVVVGTSVALDRAPLPIGVRVAFVVADDGVWILNWE